MMGRVFLLEDDPVLGRTMKRGFELEGYEVVWARDLRMAKATLRNNEIDLYVLDWNLPDGIGLSLCEMIRKIDKSVPVIFLTARTEEETAIQALKMGAQDFLRKPCGQGELNARVKRLLGEALNQEKVLRFGDLVLLLGSRKARFRDLDLVIHHKEFDVLVHLVENGGIVSSRESILNIIDPEQSISDRAIDAHMSRLRVKFRALGIDALEIKSIYGQGYRLEKAG